MPPGLPPRLLACVAVVTTATFAYASPGPGNHGALYAIRAPGWREKDNAEYGPRAARAVDHVIARIRAGKIEDELTTVMDAFADRRQRIYGAPGPFGTPRTTWSWTGGGGTSGQYYRWSEVMPARTVATLSTGEKIHLTAFVDHDFAHTDPNHIPKIVTECGPIYRRALQPGLSLKELVETVGQLHWWLAHAMPYERGSAGIVDMLTKSILLRQGVEVSPWAEGVSPDLDAFLIPEARAFGAAYHTLFSEPLRRGEERLLAPQNPARMVLYPSSSEPAGPIPKVKLYGRWEARAEAADRRAGAAASDAAPSLHPSYGLSLGNPTDDTAWRAASFAAFAPRSRNKDPLIAAFMLHHRIGLPEDATTLLLALEPSIAQELVARLPGTYLTDVLRLAGAIARVLPDEAARAEDPLRLARDAPTFLALLRRAEPLLRARADPSYALMKDAQELDTHLRAIAARALGTE